MKKLSTLVVVGLLAFGVVGCSDNEVKKEAKQEEVKGTNKEESKNEVKEENKEEVKQEETKEPNKEEVNKEEGKETKQEEAKEPTKQETKQEKVKEETKETKKEEPKETKQVTTNPNQKNMETDVIGRWSNENLYISLKKENNNLVMGMSTKSGDGEMLLEIQNATKDKVETFIASAFPELLAREVGGEVIFTMKDGKLEMDTIHPNENNTLIVLSKTDASIEKWRGQ